VLFRFFIKFIFYSKIISISISFLVLLNILFCELALLYIYQIPIIICNILIIRTILLKKKTLHLQFLLAFQATSSLMLLYLYQKTSLINYPKYLALIETDYLLTSCVNTLYLFVSIFFSLINYKRSKTSYK